MNTVNYNKLSIQELKQLLDEVDEAMDKVWRDDLADPNGSWEKYQEKLKPVKEKYYQIFEVYSTKVTVDDVKTREYSDLDKECQMSVEAFKEMCEDGYICSYDGHGVYATEDKVTDLSASIKLFKENKINPNFKYVCWYNK